MADPTAAHETHIEADPDADAFLWVCSCGDGDELFSRADAHVDARVHERAAG